jgi:hypothetical protein
LRNGSVHVCNWLGFKPSRAFTIAALVVSSTGCGRETPTDVGGPLLPGDAVRTFEVVLDAASYLAVDSAFSGFDEIFGASFNMVAHEYQGALEAHTLARFQVPTVISAPDSAGTTRSDSTPRYIGGRIVIHLDTLLSNGPAPAQFRAYRIQESWHPPTATWTHRVDTTGVQQPWSNPGGLGGAAIDTASWAAGVDSISIRVDSATIAAWADTTTLARGAVITAVTSGIRVRTVDLVLRLDARPRFRPDTVVTVTSRPGDPTFVINPGLGTQGAAPLVGGRPSWRTYMRFREGLDTLAIPCPQVSANCVIRLDQATLTFGALVFQPAASPAGYLPQDTFRLGSRALLVSPRAPVERSPLGEALGVSEDLLQPSQFLPGASREPIEVPITSFVRNLAADTVPDQPAPRWLAVLPLVEGLNFGVAAFESLPRLRLVITIANQLQLR